MGPLFAWVFPSLLNFFFPNYKFPCYQIERKKRNRLDLPTFYIPGSMLQMTYSVSHLQFLNGKKVTETKNIVTELEIS